MTSPFHLSKPLVRRVRRAVLALAPLIIACGPHFYQAPPPLAHYPERTAGKTWKQLVDESQPSSLETWSQINKATVDFFASFKDLDDSARQDGLRDLIERNRATRYHRDVGNLLLECDELLNAPTPGFESYLASRASQLGSTVPSPPVPRWNLDDDEFDRLVNRYQRARANLLKKSQHELKTCPAGLLPNHQVRHAALLMRLGEFGGAHQFFCETFNAHRTHPRGEVAAFMIGRCSLAIARDMPDGTPEEHQLQRDQYDVAEEELANYLEAFPNGRFADDAYGWLGAVASDQKRIALAIDRQLERLGIQQTREVRYSTLRECDVLFGQMFEDAIDEDFWDSEHSHPGSLPDFDLLSSHQDAARLFLFHALDPAYKIHLPIYASNDTGDRGTLHFLERNIIQNSAFARYSLKELGHAVRGKDTPLDSTSLLILGWSALRDDDPAQALALFDRGLADVATDELLHARATALSRLERYQESADAYALLDTSFPSSPLNKPSRFDHALALHRAGESGESILLLLELDGFYEAEFGRNPAQFLHPDYETIQWIDTLAQFAPIEDIRRPLDRLPAGDPRTRVLRALVRTRALCEENFTLAGKHLDDDEHPAFPIHQFSRRWNAHQQIHLTGKRWNDDLTALRNTARAIRLASPRDPGLPAAHLRHARQWESLRGQVTLPLHQVFDYSSSESQKIDQLRRTNARILGMSDAQITKELDSRDELHHALELFLAATKSSHPDIAAPALEGANEILFRLAEFSPYQCSRAAETGATSLSNKLVDRLENDFPDRAETARAVRYNFLPPDLLGDWMPGDYNTSNADSAIAEALGIDHTAEADEETNQRYEAILATLHFLPHSDQTIEEIRHDLDRSMKEFKAIRAKLGTHQLLRLVDHLDDLHAAAHMPKVTPDQLGEYAALRLSNSAPMDEPADDSPLKSFYRFLALIRPLPSGNEPTRQSPETWKTFIEGYPKSPKLEAASLRRTRILVRQAVPIPHVRAFHFPASPIANGYKQLRSTPSPDLLGAAFKAIDEHLTRFPSGRYQRDIDLLQAACNTWTDDTASALAQLSEILNDPRHPELHGDASLHFAFLTQGLLTPSKRPDLVAAIRNSPTSVVHLEKLAHGDTCLSRLRPMLPWLKDQL